MYLDTAFDSINKMVKKLGCPLYHNLERCLARKY